MSSNWWLLQSRSKRPGAKRSWGAVEIHGFPWGNDPWKLRIFYIYGSLLVCNPKKQYSELWVPKNCRLTFWSVAPTPFCGSKVHTAVLDFSKRRECFWCRMLLPRLTGDPKSRRDFCEHMLVIGWFRWSMKLCYMIYVWSRRIYYSVYICNRNIWHVNRHNQPIFGHLRTASAVRNCQRSLPARAKPLQPDGSNRHVSYVIVIPYHMYAIVGITYYNSMWLVCNTMSQWYVILSIYIAVTYCMCIWLYMHILNMI